MGLVYSSETGRTCPNCQKPIAKCACTTPEVIPPSDSVVQIARATSGRKGRHVTTITGVPLGLSKLTVLAKELKKRCGSGGTIKGQTIEIQGDFRPQLAELLRKKGYRVKVAGGQ